MSRSSSFPLACSLSLLVFSCVLSQVHAADQIPPASRDQLLAEYFRIKTQELSDRCLAEIQSADDWNSHKDEYRRQLQEMLGLLPWPERTPLKPEVTGLLERDDLVVEKLHFESLPGLYVTANFYRPKVVEKPLPAILYVCGHSSQKEGKISFGNKTGYQHHGEWFARSGYVCLTIDTIQLGEIQGHHHGTNREGMWWWQSRGYTPAGVEAWNGIRALDYLQSRPEVDPERIGMTGRSGGGAYTWYVSALDERVKVSAPVAGITTLKNHVVDRCIEGHCDCMFQVNTYGWDYPQLAALVAPRPLLICNTDKDTIFPLDGVVDVYNKTRRIYKLLGAEDKIGLCIAEGPHKDRQELQNDVFHWFNRFLKHDDPPQLTLAADKLFQPAELRVFQDLPADERVTSVQEWFVPSRARTTPPNSQADFQTAAGQWKTFLRDQVFRHLGPASSQDPAISALQTDSPAETPNGAGKSDALDVKLVGTWEKDHRRIRKYEFTSEQPYRLYFYVLDRGETTKPGTVHLEVLDAEQWQVWVSRLQACTGDAQPCQLEDFDETRVLFAPRGVVAAAWASDLKKATHIRRSFALLGTTEDRLQIEDTARALAAVNQALNPRKGPLSIEGQGIAAGWVLYASLISPNVSSVTRLSLKDLSSDPAQGPFLLNIDRQMSRADALLLAASRVGRIDLVETAGNTGSWQAAADAAKKLNLGPIHVSVQK